MNIGVLRKEVDGQGLTSKNGITPIARQIIKSRTELFTTRKSIIKKLIT